ncbi:TPA: tyrosine-type recombinase/integrase [Klebsiella pneumoniae]|uniref:phage integrase n=1 Tax=Klebsiella pneumoniae TaxID=573 RepID=UPI000E2F7069|nr:tyrosine-type recombinase/integrase [Klebsiella pneumoniae]HBR1366630.1 tyrosine-type recombinase/integrase [Klebsiella pneumoniae]HBR2015043.1 tyrosine-type recombinase/integrase [Klebsiella pneumoniae]
MTITKLDDGRYKVDVRPHGRNGKRIRKVFDKRSEAVAFERYSLAQTQSPEWAADVVDRRPLSELREIWWDLFGHAKNNADIERRQLDKTIRQMGAPTVNQLTPRFILEFRAGRIAEKLKASTINRDIYRMSGMFSELLRARECRVNPFREIEPLKETPAVVTYLTMAEIETLLSEFTGDSRKLALLCLSTGARFGEAASLRAENVIGGRVTFVKTKNGKQRTIPISKELEREIKTKDSGNLFTVDYKWFARRLKKIKPDLPDGQATHVLRHTFGSHFVMNGGNIVALSKILGHANIQQTMVYAHLAPDYLQHAVLLNPARHALEKEAESVHDVSTV